MLRKKLKLDPVEVTTCDAGEQSNENAVRHAVHQQFWEKFYNIECRLNVDLRSIDFVKGAVAAVYNPIEYAAGLHCAYLARFLTGPKSVLFVGMNPGPWGMVQTGVIVYRIGFSATFLSDSNIILYLYFNNNKGSFT